MSPPPNERGDDMADEPDIDTLSASVASRLKDMPWTQLVSPDPDLREDVHTRVAKVREDLAKIEAVDPQRALRIWDLNVLDDKEDIAARKAKPEGPQDVAPSRRRPSSAARSPDDSFRNTDAYEAAIERQENEGIRAAEADLKTQKPRAGEPEAANTIEQGRKRRRDGTIDPALVPPNGQGGREEPRDPPPAVANGVGDPTVTAEGARNARAAMLMENLNKRYTVAGDAYHFRTPEAEVAFEAKPKAISTKLDDPVVAAAMVDLAEARGWDSLKVKGSETFKREVWMQASARGLEVEGYAPREVDKVRLEDWKAERAGARPGERVEPSSPRIGDRTAAVNEEPRLALTPEQKEVVAGLQTIMTARGDSAEAVAKASEIAAERFRTRRVYVGKIIETGSAPYQDKAEEKDSPYVVLVDDKGHQSKVRGVDIPRAMEEAKAKPGDSVALAFGGRKAVVVDVPNRHETTGKVTGYTRTEVMRNTWEMVPLDQLRDAARARAAPTPAQQQPPEPQRVRGQERSR
ncbi:LPD7 domain-containing protein [Asticcacaulis sp. W401b]|uniref:LPD7 domain-containing protein n=1 Tax=Asticcacaulis sp. W401b TaxID=3388666 RepID=UPI0039705E23